MRFVFTNYAKKQFLKLDLKAQNRIKDKLTILKNDALLLNQNIRPVINLNPITHRVRIGSYRLLLKLEGESYIVLKLGHRKEIYN